MARPIHGNSPRQRGLSSGQQRREVPQARDGKPGQRAQRRQELERLPRQASLLRRRDPRQQRKQGVRHRDGPERDGGEVPGQGKGKRAVVSFVEQPKEREIFEGIERGRSDAAGNHGTDSVRQRGPRGAWAQRVWAWDGATQAPRARLPRPLAYPTPVDRALLLRHS